MRQPLTVLIFFHQQAQLQVLVSNSAEHPLVLNSSDSQLCITSQSSSFVPEIYLVFLQTQQRINSSHGVFPPAVVSQEGRLPSWKLTCL